MYLQSLWYLIGILFILLAAVIEIREQNLFAQGQNEPTELHLSLLSFILEKGQGERKTFWQRVCLGSFMCEDTCSGGIGGGGGTVESFPLIPELYL